MSPHPNTTPASPSLASPLTDAAFDSIELLTNSFAASEAPTFDTTTVIEVGLSFRRITQYNYLPGSTSLKSSVTVNGAKTDYTYDYHNRVLEVKQHTSSGRFLSSTKTYLNNQLLCDTDPYGRRKYYGYRASDGTLIQTVTATHPGYTLADFAEPCYGPRSGLSPSFEISVD
ncbi:MAG: hypothetical protein MUC43_11255 [Pirellula sp.]|jgi:hypothetical protein|nr:hypothetical protein [Pirellula sp.]